MNNPIYSTWCISNNVGDTLTSYLIEKITGQSPIYVPPEVFRPKFMVAGSMLNHAIGYTTVWGAGLADIQHDVSPVATYAAVRGPISCRKVRLQAGHALSVMGDPGLLMPRFYKPTVPKKYKVCICPHYLHQAEAFEWARGIGGVRILNVFEAPETFAMDMLECEVVYSSSLHGLIFADAYGIPSQWIDGTAKLGGDGMKFEDHLLIRHFLSEEEDGYNKLIAFAQDSQAPWPTMFRRIHIQELPRDVDALRDSLIDTPPPDFTELTDALWDACPFKPKEPEE